MKIKIGLVDDHQLFLKSLSLMLLTLGDYDVVVEAFNGQDLQRKIAQVKETPDIILLDVNMPVMDGIITAAWLRTSFPLIKLVALTMNDHDNSIIQMFRNGCCAYLLKDVHPTELNKALKQVYSSGYYNADSARFNAGRLLVKAEKDPRLHLTVKEKSFLQLACSEKTYKHIAIEMGVAERTVDGYRESLFRKFGVQSRVGLCLEALRRDLVSL